MPGKPVLIRCPGCRLNKPKHVFYDPAGAGRQRKTCLACRGYPETAVSTRRTCPGLPKSWGYGECQKTVESTYRCETCSRIWREHHGIDSGHKYHGIEYGAGLNLGGAGGIV